MKINVALKIVLLLLLLAAGIFVAWREGTLPDARSRASSFEECVRAGNAVMESYPRQCRMRSGKIFREYIGNELEKDNLIRLSSPRPNEYVRSPLEVRGVARGSWFFEASFPLVVTDGNGKIIGQGYATAQDNWMTEDFVSFVGTVLFDTAEIQSTYSGKGTLILQKSNASGLSEHNDALEIPIVFE
jgi:hypothetical protein